eukprot:scaffold11824_cov125-Isochrysis_galbana.AAC.4
MPSGARKAAPRLQSLGGGKHGALGFLGVVGGAGVGGAGRLPTGAIYCCTNLSFYLIAHPKSARREAESDADIGCCSARSSDTIPPQKTA